MKLWRASAIATSILVALAHDAAPQPPDRRPVFRSRTEAVTVDVVVRDRTGRHVAGLAAEDFEVLEDGVLQRILSRRGPLVRGTSR